MTFSPKASEREEKAWVPGCLSSLRIKFICFSSFFCSCLLIACRSDSFPRCVAVVFDEETSTRPKGQHKLSDIYGCLVCATFVFTISRSQAFLLASLKCSERLRDKMVVSVLQTPVLFFDSNPVGRIMNRFSKDVGCLDEVLPKNFLISIQMLAVFASILVPTVTNQWLLLAVVPMTVLFLYIIPQSRLLSHFREHRWTGHDSHTRETNRFRGTVSQVLYTL